MQLNVKNPNYLETSKVATTEDTGNYDTLINNDKYGIFQVGYLYRVSEPSQIHILGSKKDIEGFKKYMKKEEQENKRFPSNSLEGKVITSVFCMLAIAGLFFGISSLTGAAIGFLKSFSLPIGILLFVVGILGLFLSNKS